jgi:hypothetical protein
LGCLFLGRSCSPARSCFSFWAYYLDDVLVGIVAAFAYWFFSQYQLQIVDRRKSIAYLDDTIRNALEALLLIRGENLTEEVAAAVRLRPGPPVTYPEINFPT